jgi:hypothetical protein
MTTKIATMSLFFAGVIAVGYLHAQDGLGQRLGKKIDQGLNEIGSDLRRGWASVRQSVDKLGVQGRVYGRLHWDKALANATIDIQVPQEGVIVLKGSVPNTAAQLRAVNLARETVGVKQVTDELSVPRDQPSPAGQPPAGN